MTSCEQFTPLLYGDVWIFFQIGVAIFCLIHLVHSLLQFSEMIIYVFEGHTDCYTIERIMMHFLIPVFSFLQLYTVYKYSNVSQHKLLSNQELSCVSVLVPLCCQDS